jgi:hypothetical protein
MIGFRRKKFPELAGECGQPESVSAGAVQVSQSLGLRERGQVVHQAFGGTG